MSRKFNIEWKKLFNLQKAKEELNRRTMFNAPFNAHKLKLALRRLKIKKSPRVDCIHAEFFVHLGSASRKTVLNILNRVRESGQILTQWKSAIIIPVLKKNKDSRLLYS